MKRLILPALSALVVVSAPAFANDVDPFGFEKQAQSPSTMTRADVNAAMKQKAVITMKIDDQGRLITMPSVKSRAQVAAEAAAASRLGLNRFGEMEPVQGTPAQEQAIQLAGQRALGQSGSIE